MIMGIHSRSVNLADFSADFRLVTASADGSARVWDVNSHNTVAVFTGSEVPISPKKKKQLEKKGLPCEPERREVRYAAFSPDGSKVVAVTDADAKVCDAASSSEICVL